MGTCRGIIDLLTIVYEVIRGAEGSTYEEGVDWDRAGFKQAILLAISRAEARGMRRLKVSAFDEIWRDWKAGAAEGRRKASAKAVAVTRNNFDKAVGLKREDVTVGDLRKAVERVR